MVAERCRECEGCDGVVLWLPLLLTTRSVADGVQGRLVD